MGPWGHGAMGSWCGWWQEAEARGRAVREAGAGKRNQSTVCAGGPVLVARPGLQPCARCVLMPNVMILRGLRYPAVAMS